MNSKMFSRVLLFLALFMGGFPGPAPSTWAKETQTLEHRVIVEQARTYLLSQLPLDPNDVSISVEYTGEDLVLPAGKVDLQYKLIAANPGVGRVPMGLEISVDGRLIRKIWLNARVEAFFDVVRTTRPVPRGRLIGPGDIEIVRVRSAQPLHNVVYNPEEVIGLKALSDLDPGQTLSPFMVKRVPLVKRGDRVLLVAERGPLRVTAPGVVKENGHKNATIQVENLQTRKIIYGTVVDSKTVNVEF